MWTSRRFLPGFESNFSVSPSFFIFIPYIHLSILISFANCRCGVAELKVLTFTTSTHLNFLNPPIRRHATRSRLPNAVLALLRGIIELAVTLVGLQWAAAAICAQGMAFNWIGC
jgi:hypothetical protein